ncbi:MAG: arsenosugar biosynthesis radical SAM (seleno)protein ArsS [Synechococcus sp.]
MTPITNKLLTTRPASSAETLPPAFPPLVRSQLQTLQVNLGYRCNQSCSHCHVNAGPWRTEMMAPDQVALIPRVLEHLQLKVLDLTGGAPELHPQFRELVVAARSLGVEVIDRCNLTILNEPSQDGLAAFLAQQQVRVVASLPCTEEARVDRQRGRGVFERSIDGLRDLNALGYGDPKRELILDLVYNPAGANLPPAQAQLEQHYRDALWKDHGLRFNHLLTITNMAIERFAQDLERQGILQTYRQVLRDAFRAENLPAVMCRSLISVNWTGQLFDCDFNQQLGLGCLGTVQTLDDLLRITPDAFSGASIAVGEHCFGCTAGNGSSCSGALN